MAAGAWRLVYGKKPSRGHRLLNCRVREPRLPSQKEEWLLLQKSCERLMSTIAQDRCY